MVCCPLADASERVHIDEPGAAANPVAADLTGRHQPTNRPLIATGQVSGFTRGDQTNSRVTDSADWLSGSGHRRWQRNLRRQSEGPEHRLTPRLDRQTVPLSDRLVTDQGPQDVPSDPSTQQRGQGVGVVLGGCHQGTSGSPPAGAQNTHELAGVSSRSGPGNFVPQSVWMTSGGASSSPRQNSTPRRGSRMHETD
jgi:hypothetical protein